MFLAKLYCLLHKHNWEHFPTLFGQRGRVCMRCERVEIKGMTRWVEVAR